MSVLKTNRALQTIIAVVPLSLYVLLFILMTMDFTVVYGTAYKNAEMIKSDDKVLGVVSWSIEDEQIVMLDVDGEEHKEEIPELSLTMDNKKHIAYYSKESNMLMQPVDESYIEEFIRGYNFPFVVGCISAITILLFFVNIAKNFTELSKARYFIVYAITIVVSLSVVLLYFQMFK